MSEHIVDLPYGGAADEHVRLSRDTRMLYGYDLHEEIVRCRDCQFGYQHDCKRYPNDKKYMGKWYCIAWGDGMQGEWTREDGFCHRGKPRSES